MPSFNDKGDYISPSYYITIPSEVCWCGTIEPEAKLLYGGIAALCTDRGFCEPTYEDLAQLLKTEVENVKRWVRSLRDQKFIYLEKKTSYVRIYLNKECKKRFEALKRSEKKRLEKLASMPNDLSSFEEGQSCFY